MGKTRDLNKKIRDRLNKVWSSLEDDCYRKNRVGEIWYIGGIGAGYSVAEMVRGSLVAKVTCEQRFEEKE